MTTIHRSQQSKGWVFIVLLLGSVSAFDSDPEQGQHAATWPTSSEVAQPARDDVTETANVISTSTMASSSPAREARSAEADGSATSLGNNNTVLIPDTSAYSTVQLYALLVDVLEKLNILVPATASCYQLQKIVHEVLPDGASESGRAVGVSLFFRETPLSASPASSASTSGTNDSSKADVTGSEEAATLPPRLSASHAVGVKNECTSSPDLIHSMNAQPLVRSEVLNDTHGRRVDGSQEDANDTGVAGTDNQNEASGAFEYANNGKQESYLLGGLSRTQVVVISTCSAIIALFFLVAAILRVRNYIKRIREEQAMRERPTFRSCSVRLRSASQSNDHFRRDSQTSKLSHQSNYNIRGPGYSHTNGSSSRENSNASSPRHDPDTKPLLVVTAVTEGHSPTVSQSSLQFIDEEPVKKVNGKHHIRNDADDPESRPLLISETTATSPTSSSSSPVSPTSPAVSSSLQGNNCSGRVAAAVRTVPRSLPVKNGSSQAYYQRVSESPTPSPLSANKGDSGVLETSLDDLAKRSPSCTVGERKTPPRFNDVSATAGVPLIRFCGLTQSDSSLSSADGNRNYNYGNQVEYSPPEWGLVSGGEHLNGLNSPYALTVVGQPHAVFLGMQINASKEKTNIVPTGCDSAFSKTSADNTEKHQCSDSPETKMVDALMSGPYPMSIGDSGNETNPCSTEAGSYGSESSRLQNGLRQQECSVNEQLFPEKCVGSGGSGNYNDVNICVSENDVPCRSDQNGVGVPASCSTEISGPTPESGECEGHRGPNAGVRLTSGDLSGADAQTFSHEGLNSLGDAGVENGARPAILAGGQREGNASDLMGTVQKVPSEQPVSGDDNRLLGDVSDFPLAERGGWARTPRNFLGKSEEKHAPHEMNNAAEENNNRTRDLVASGGPTRSASVGDDENCYGVGSSSSTVTVSEPEKAITEGGGSEKVDASSDEITSHSLGSVFSRRNSSPPQAPGETSAVVKSILSLDELRTTFL